MRRGLTAACLCLLIAAALPAGANERRQPLNGEGRGLRLVANVPYSGGTDMEFLTQNGRDYALTGSSPSYGPESAMRVIDITDPEHPFLAASLRCPLDQMDIQISHDGRTAILAADYTGGGCAAAGRVGFVTVDISNVLKPRVIGFAEVFDGSHNTTAHPTQPIVYSSPSGGPITIWSIADPSHPREVGRIPASSHDLAFDRDGSLMVTAGGQYIRVYDTSDAMHPKLLHETVCPCAIAHDAKFTPDSRYVIAGDEAGGGGTHPCPGGGLFFYRLGEDGLRLVGAYEPFEIVTATGRQQPQPCTSHVMDVSDDGKRLAVSWYAAGTRYLDISTMDGFTFGPLAGGVKELGWFVPVRGLSWSSKFYKGPYIYSNDMNRGFDVYRIAG